METQFLWQPEWNVTNSFVLRQFEFIFGMEVPWSDKNPATYLVAMITQLPFQPEWNVTNCFVLREFDFMFGMEVSWSDKHQPDTLLLL